MSLLYGVAGASCSVFDVHPVFRQSVSQLFHGPAPRSPLRRLSVRLRRVVYGIVPES